MTHAEALYAYNQWIAMNDWVNGLDMALVAGAVDSAELPAMLECHAEALEKAIAATMMFNRTEITEPLKRYRVNIRKAIADITRLNREAEQAESQ